ncbi:hypothetical protein F2Q69_00017923 [Brassica cretica]|uniref:Uncharacterized protein n=1 Tax=Brassica cretica TaxID=69181 RepID=A0A8S9QY46_BRACR|nr:hypothetical protein F2Q69_00017923 [Brassica cretica]
MRPNLRSLVAKAYRVRQGRTFSSSSSAPNPVGDEGAISIYEWLLPRGFATLTGFVTASYFTGDTASKFDEMVKEVDNLNRLVGGKDVVWLPDVDTIFSPRLCKSVQVAESPFTKGKIHHNPEDERMFPIASHMKNLRQLVATRKLSLLFSKWCQIPRRSCLIPGGTFRKSFLLISA